MKRFISLKLSIVFLFYASLKLHASNSFPFAVDTIKKIYDEDPYDINDVRTYKRLTIAKDGKPLIGDSKDKDISADNQFLGYESKIVEKGNKAKIFETELDLTKVSGNMCIAILVDDVGKLTISGESLEKPLHLNVNGTALWNKRSYKEFTNQPLKGVFKYNLHLSYENTANLTNSYGGSQDFDGAIIFVFKQPDVIVQKMAFTDDSAILNADISHEQDPTKRTYKHHGNSWHWIDENVDSIPDPAKGKNLTIMDKFKSYPVTYVRNSTGVNVRAKFKSINSNITEIFIRASIVGQKGNGLELPSKKINIANAKNYLGASTNHLINEVKCYITANRGAAWRMDDPFIIQWESSLDGQIWSGAGISEHTIYLMRGKQVASEERYKNDAGEIKYRQIVLRQETVFFLATRKGDRKKLMKNIWSHFEENKLSNIENKPLTYYKAASTKYVTPMDLLKHRQGQCFCFSYLLIDIIQAHGVDLKKADIRIDYVRKGAFFLVNNWSTNGKPTIGSLDKSRLKVEPKYTAYINKIIKFDGGFHKLSGTVNDDHGVGGQNNGNPLSFFANHHVAKIGNTYYDPSYGKKYSSRSDLVKNAIAYVAIQNFTSHNGTKEFDEKAENKDINGDGKKNQKFKYMIWEVSEFEKQPQPQPAYHNILNFKDEAYER